MSEKVCKDMNLKITVGRLVETFCERNDKLKIYIAVRLVTRIKMQRKRCKVWDPNKIVAYTALGLRKQR